MITENMDQLSPAWFAARCGIPSASNFGMILTPTGKPSAQATKYAYQLAGERLTGIKEEGYSNAAMLRGVEMEPEARSYYEFAHDVEVEQVGICYYDKDKSFSCSPDGLMPDIKRGLEIKCPMLSTHVEYLLGKKLPTIYLPQVMGSMLVTGYDTWAFLSYYPGMPALDIVVTRDEEYIEKLQRALYDFNQELREVIKAIK